MISKLFQNNIIITYNHGLWCINLQKTAMNHVAISQSSSLTLNKSVLDPVCGWCKPSDLFQTEQFKREL